MKSTKGLFVAVALGIVCFASNGIAADTNNPSTSSGTKSKGQVSAEARNVMADAHKKMADCLSSDKTMDECRQEMHTAMKSMHDKYGASCCGGQGMMMGMMGDHHGHMAGNNHNGNMMNHDGWDNDWCD